MELIVPDLKEIKDEDLQIWECNQTKAPSFRPQNIPAHIDYALDGFWGEEGGEKALFLKAATCELRAVAEPSRCIVYFLVQKNARSARLVAKNQNGSTCMVIPLIKTVRIEKGPRHITINEEKIILHNEREVNLLSCLLEAANFYYSERSQSYNSLDALKAYTVLVAVKNRYLDLVAGLMANSSMFVLPSDIYQVVCTVTAIAKDYVDGRLNQQLLSEDAFSRDMDGGKVPREMLTLTSWAIRIGHTPLVQLLIAENTVRGDWLVQRSLSLLSMAAYQGHHSVARLLITSKYGGKT